MLEELKNKLKEIGKLADSVPEKYQERCFSILLEHFLLTNEQTQDLNLKARKNARIPFVTPAGQKFSGFVEQNQLSKVINNVFHRENGTCEVIVKKLKTTKKAIGQVRLALLIGIKHLAEEGEPNIPWEELKGLCEEHSVFDSPNFSGNMKKSKNLFLPRKDGEKGWRLTNPGLAEAAELIEDLGSAKE